MGSNKNENFDQSRIYISDGEFECNLTIYKKEGTKINAEFGSAESHEKYEIECIPEDSILKFQIECEVDKEADEVELEKLMIKLADGFDKKEFLLGGQKNNGFGSFKDIKLEKSIYEFKTCKDVDEYICGKKVKREPVNFSIDNNESQKLTISMKGCFPYGVYQNFDLNLGKNITGIQKYKNIDDKFYIPGSSIKGIVKNGVVLLIKRFIVNNDNKVQEKIDEMFGNNSSKGKIRFSDVIVDSNKDNIKEYCYIKIDRLTGNAMDKAIKNQQEIEGQATVSVTINAKHETKYIFPICYIMKNIAIGNIPIGGRTGIGLGEFNAKEIYIDSKPFKIADGSLIDDKNRTIEEYFNQFKRWCDK